jgi:outer membrane protein assembly factor BamB
MLSAEASLRLESEGSESDTKKIKRGKKKMSKNRLKISFAIFVAFLLLFGVFAIVPTSASPLPDLEALRASLNPTEIGPESNLYKYMTHVPHTEYEWAHPYYNASTCCSSPAPACKTDHLLWKTFLGSRDWYNDPVGLNHIFTGIFDGKIIVSNTKTARDPFMWALDQNTGDIVWAAPNSGNDMYKLDDERFATRKGVYSIETGQKLYSIPRDIELWIPELKIAVCDGPSTGPTGRIRRFIAYDFSDTTQPPVELWMTDPAEAPIQELTRPAYGNGKLFHCDNFVLYAFDIQTGRKVWSTMTRGSPCLCYRQELAFAYDRIYFGAYYNGGQFCYDAETGKELFWFQGTGGMARGPNIDQGVLCYQEMGSYYWGIDAYDGHPIWKHVTEHKLSHHANPSSPKDIGPEGYMKTSIHV